VAAPKQPAQNTNQNKLIVLHTVLLLHKTLTLKELGRLR